MFVEEIIDIVKESEEKDPKSIAEAIASAASEACFESRLSPFAKGARETGWQYWGGKIDDVTVVVGKVTE